MGQISSEERFREMAETLEQIQPELHSLNKILDNHKLVYTDDLSKYCLSLLHKRFENKTKAVRSYFVRKIFEYVQNCEDYKNVDNNLKYKIGFLFEIVITIQYLHNHIIDSKLNINERSGITKNLISANILRTVLFEYLEKVIKDFKQLEIRDVLLKYTQKSLLYVDLGQQVEQVHTHYNSYVNNPKIEYNASSRLKLETDLQIIREIIYEIKQEMPQKADFIEIYFRRIYLTNTSLFRIAAEMVLEVLKYNGKEKQNILDFSVAYGMSLQIVNDNIDFVPMETVGKNENDVLSDLKNLNITLPLIYHLDKDLNRQIEKYLNNPKDKHFVTNYPQEITREIIESDGLSKSIRVGRNITKVAISLLNEKNKATPYLKHMAGIGLWNKHYMFLKEGK